MAWHDCALKQVFIRSKYAESHTFAGMEGKAYMIPVSRQEIEGLGWTQPDVILFSGDAFVDHPAFGVAVLARVLQSYGYKVAVVPQPNWQDDLRDFKKLGAPRLFFGVSAGNMDSMVNHYTAKRRLRSDDAYTPGGKAGQRPDYPTIVYTQILKKLFPETPVVMGGIEASMRRFTHYDYWQNTLKPGILHLSGADRLIYGMAEYPVINLARQLDEGGKAQTESMPDQTQMLENEIPQQVNPVYLHSHEDCLNSKVAFAENFLRIERHANNPEGKVLVQKIKDKYLITYPPAPPLSAKKLDRIYDLPFSRQPHHKYNNKGSIPAWEMIRNSVTAHRGCFGGCAFCTIAVHQGKQIQSRSPKSIAKEVEKVTNIPGYKGHITDVGGPSANMYKMHPINLNLCKSCHRPSCIYPSVCKNLNTDHRPLTDLYRQLARNSKVKKLTIGSGIRYDLIFAGGKKYEQSALEYFKELVVNHVSGRLKVAPEHTEEKVLKMMRKPSFDYFLKMKETFMRIQKEHNKNQQIVPYFISGHPGCSKQHMASLQKKARQHDLITDLMQEFTPTPMTLSTVIYYTGMLPADAGL